MTEIIRAIRFIRVIRGWVEKLGAIGITYRLNGLIAKLCLHPWSSVKISGSTAFLKLNRASRGGLLAPAVDPEIQSTGYLHIDESGAFEERLDLRLR